MATKYRNKKTKYNGIMFDSIKEANYYKQLLLREKSGDISNIVLQPVYILQEKFNKNGKHHRAIKYLADFRFYDNIDELEYVVDVKGFETAVFKIKRKLFEKKFPDLTLTLV